MRASSFAAGMLAIAGLVADASGVYAQVDAFNASRKMQGSKFYAGTTAPSDPRADSTPPAYVPNGAPAASFGSAAVADTAPGQVTAQPIATDAAPPAFGAPASTGSPTPARSQTDDS